MLIHTRDLVEHLQNILHGLGHRTVRKEHERVPLAGRVGLSSEEGLDEFWPIRNEVLMFAVDGIDGEDSILPHV